MEAAHIFRSQGFCGSGSSDKRCLEKVCPRLGKLARICFLWHKNIAHVSLQLPRNRDAGHIEGGVPTSS